MDEGTNEDFSKSGMSLFSMASTNTYRAGVEALVKEACPDQLDRIGEYIVNHEFCLQFL